MNVDSVSFIGGKRGRSKLISDRNFLDEDQETLESFALAKLKLLLWLKLINPVQPGPTFFADFQHFLLLISVEKNTLSSFSLTSPFYSSCLTPVLGSISCISHITQWVM